MKQLLTILLLLPWGLQAQETCDTDYRSPRIHYYVSCPDGSDTRRQADPGQAVRAGSDIWILLLQDDGNAVLAKHAGKNLHYGIRERESTYGPLTRREAVEVLNRWIAHYCHLTEQDRKEGRIGYNTPCYTGIADSPLKVGPDFRSGNSLSLKEGERGWRFIHTGTYSEETGMELWTSRDFRRAVYYRSGGTARHRPGGTQKLHAPAGVRHRGLPAPEPDIRRAHFPGSPARPPARRDEAATAGQRLRQTVR